MRRRVKKGDTNIKFKLAERMKEQGMSKNKLCKESGFRFETIVTIHGFFQINKQIGLAIFSFLGHNIVNKVGVHKI